jgi:hypothetical protein
MNYAERCNPNSYSSFNGFLRISNFSNKPSKPELTIHNDDDDDDDNNNNTRAIMVMLLTIRNGATAREIQGAPRRTVYRAFSVFRFSVN